MPSWITQSHISLVLTLFDIMKYLFGNLTKLELNIYLLKNININLR